VYHTPASTFVASFIGAPPMNLLKAAPYAPSGMILGVRPEHLQVLPAATTDSWQAMVVGIEMLGAERLIYCALSGLSASEPIVVRVNETTPPPAIGENLALLPQVGKLHTFDAMTGLRVSSVAP
jgi:sn-glycerol 3-phosphate transport system ATP-binding protein